MSQAPTPRRAPRQDRAARTRASILDAAEALLADMPPAAITTRALAETAGVPIGSVYRYFADATGVLRALFERLNERTVEALEETRAAPAPDWRDDLARLGETVLRMHEAHPVYGALMRWAEPRGAGADTPMAAILTARLGAARPDLPAARAARVAGTVLSLMEATEHRYHAVRPAERNAAFAEGMRAVEAYLALYLDGPNLDGPIGGG